MSYIPAEELSALRKRIAKVNKRATDQGLAGGLSLEIGERKWVPDPRIENEVLAAYFKIETVEVTVSGSAPCFDGWTFLATITNDNGALVIRNAVGVEDVDRDSVRPGECDHCSKNRRRSNTYLIEKDGQRIQVGSSCVKDFLGHSVSLNSFFSDPLEGDFDFGPRCWDVQHVIALAIDCIEAHGFRRSSETNSTRELVQKELDGLQAASQAAYSKAAKVVEWIASSVETGDYMDNLRAVIKTGTVSNRNLGLAGLKRRSRHDRVKCVVGVNSWCEGQAARWA